MAKYKVIKCELLKDVNKFNYLKLELLNTHCTWEPTIAMCIHDHNIIERILIATHKLRDELPENMCYVYGKWVDYSFGFPFYKKHTKAHPACGDRPPINVGDLVCVGGKPVEYRSLQVFCLTDENGFYLRCNNPAEVANKLFNRYCIPANNRADYIISSNNRQSMIENITERDAIKCAEAMNELAGWNITLSKVIYKIGNSPVVSDSPCCCTGSSDD
jgi:hypothetical protein